ncbi:MAG: hypothetical protein M3O50_17700, partial [Myxococcota bacterium]|nr:hypothetical protein [Myxococcota bacterium]
MASSTTSPVGRGRGGIDSEADHDAASAGAASLEGRVEAALAIGLAIARGADDPAGAGFFRCELDPC